MSNTHEDSESSQSSPKIIVDSDWKEQVAKEKEAAAAAASEPTDTTDETAESTPETSPPSAAVDVESKSAESKVGESKPEETPAQEKSEGQALPAPSFEVLVSMLFTQAISALGQMPNPVSGETSVDKRMAKHSIDMLDMLTEKTKGNLSEHESKMLSEALHALRMTYVSVRD
ncbi:DUF1844 domain-containing protein [Aporhodopirellula aestuarii]|uniref:DUF1844 domain-containing protein n=1 Tax=Aporhodopirellula aestuarii TaxID=2950107 RepID=A0ABT0UER6_9BACT|nr:DUF1844 domain-containing protein [Aporhodopirellula aestuarii]MCM2375170.1 DUF1844 domain-containing protein [Aporhodopirellula aestuarii]